MRASFAIVTLLGLLSLAMLIAHRPLPPLAQPAKAIAGRFALQDNGKTVLDRVNGLRWQQGSSTTTMNWAAAKAWCSNNTPVLPGTGWRLPTVRELQTIVDRQTGEEGMGTDAVFGATPKFLLWTMSPWVGGGSTWFVGFGSGDSYYSPSQNAHNVRCVR